MRRMVDIIVPRLTNLINSTYSSSVIECVQRLFIVFATLIPDPTSASLDRYFNRLCDLYWIYILFTFFAFYCFNWSFWSLKLRFPVFGLNGFRTDWLRGLEKHLCALHDPHRHFSFIYDSFSPQPLINQF